MALARIAYERQREYFRLKSQVLEGASSRNSRDDDQAVHICFNQGRYQETERLEAPVLQYGREAYGAKHQKTLRKSSELALVLEHGGLYQESDQLASQVVKDKV